jgi:hypothetical protein
MTHFAESRRIQSGSFKRLSALLGLSLVSTVATCLAWSSTAKAVDYCQDISGKYIIIGDGQYETNPSSTWDDFAYANANPQYIDSFQWIGGMPSTSTDAHFLIYTAHRDTTSSDCSDVTLELQLKYGSTKDTYGCPTSYSTISTVWHFNTCSSPGVCTGNSCRIWVGKLLGFHNLSYYRYWKAVVNVNGNETGDSDEGCWPLANQNDCTLRDFNY